MPAGASSIVMFSKPASSRAFCSVEARPGVSVPFRIRIVASS